MSAPASVTAQARPPVTQTPPPTYARQSVPAPVNADAFEPPPASLTAARAQSQAAGAAGPAPATAAAIDATPDLIQAAADAFEPPPPSSRAARQQARAAQAANDATDPADPPVRVMRASTGSIAAPRPAANDDPIARFATGTN
jgi:hypothetical protein